MKRKLLALLLTTIMVLTLTACGGSEETTATTSQTSTKTDELAELQAALDEMADALDNTCWVGMDAEDYSCYSMGFADGQVCIYSNVEGDKGIEGYWNIGIDTLYVYSDEACTKQIYEIPWSYDEEDDVMILNDRAVMTQVDGGLSAAGQAIQQYAFAAQVGEFLDSTVWAGVDASRSMVMAFTLKDGQYYLGLIDAKGNKEEHTGAWSIDYDSIYLYDANNALLDTLDWDMVADGSELYFTVDSSKLTFELVQTDAANLTNALTAIADAIFVK